MKKKILALLGIIMIISLILVPLAYASTYQSSIHFSVGLRGATRSYTDDDMNIKINNPSCPVSGTFSISLYRDKFIDDYIGKVYVNRNYTSTSQWSNVGSGNYFFYFSKANDGVYVTSYDVEMWSN